jgi:hypothetical protein
MWFIVLTFAAEIAKLVSFKFEVGKKKEGGGERERPGRLA